MQEIQNQHRCQVVREGFQVACPLWWSEMHWRLLPPQQAVKKSTFTFRVYFCQVMLTNYMMIFNYYSKKKGMFWYLMWFAFLLPLSPLNQECSRCFWNGTICGLGIPESPPQCNRVWRHRTLSRSRWWSNPRWWHNESALQYGSGRKELLHR